MLRTVIIWWGTLNSRPESLAIRIAIGIDIWIVFPLPLGDRGMVVRDDRRPMAIRHRSGVRSVGVYWYERSLGSNAV